MLGSLRERGKQFSTGLRTRHWRIHEFSLSGTSTSCRPFVKVQSRNKIRLAQWCCDLTFQWFVGNYSLNHDILNWSGAIISSRVLCELFRRQIDRISPQLVSRLSPLGTVTTKNSALGHWAWSKARKRIKAFIKLWGFMNRRMIDDLIR